jgi:hypothetical protein
MKMNEIVPGIRTWSVFNVDKGMNFNGWYVLRGATAVVVDPPQPTDDVLAEIARLGRPVALILTNRHHTRAAAAIRAAFGCPLWVHEDDRGLMETPVDRTYRDGDVIECGLTVHTVRGSKTPGESSLLFDGPVRSLIVGDAVLGKPPGALSLLGPPLINDAARAIDGLARLAELDFEALLLGDGEPIVEGGRRALSRFVRAAAAER